MDVLSAVSETALITLRSRVIEAEKEKPVIEDVVGRECWHRLQALLPIETRNRAFHRNLPSTLTRHIALRSRKYDTYTRQFMAENPN
jgi:O-methyltransferase involved in polyketide biosynthesis